MLGLASTDALAPETEARGLQFATHQLDDLGFDKACLPPDFLEGRPVLPGHADERTLFLEGKPGERNLLILGHVLPWCGFSGRPVEIF